MLYRYLMEPLLKDRRKKEKGKRKKEKGKLEEWKSGIMERWIFLETEYRVKKKQGSGFKVQGSRLMLVNVQCARRNVSGVGLRMILCET